MKMQVKVLNTSIEERDFVNKDGSKRHARIAHVLCDYACPIDKRPVILNLRSYDPSWELPKIGTSWVLPSFVRRLESSDGNIYEGVV